MADNRTWMTITLEFDTTVQKGDITQGQVMDVLRNQGLISEIMITLLKTPKTKQLFGMALRYPSTLSEQQVSDLVAALKLIFGSLFMPPAPDPLTLINLDGTAGLALSTALPYVSGKLTRISVGYATMFTANSEGLAGYLSAEPSGNVWTPGVPNSSPGAYPCIGIQFAVVRPTSTPVIIPASASLVLKDINGVEIPILRTKDIVMSPAIVIAGLYISNQYFYLSAEGKLYLSSVPYDAVIPRLNPLEISWDAAVAGEAW